MKRSDVAALPRPVAGGLACPFSRSTPMVLSLALMAAGPVMANQTTTVVPTDLPAVKLFSVCGGNTLPISDTDEMIEFGDTFSLAHGAFSATQYTGITTGSATGIKLINYMNSTYTRTGDDAREAESDKTRIAMNWGGVLHTALTASTTNTTVVIDRVPNFPEDPGEPNPPIPILESKNSGATGTADEFLSDSGSNNSKYVYWIRIQDELMKVVSITSSSTSQVTCEVVRDIPGSAALASHASGKKVFVPLYVGQPGQTGGSSGTYPDGGGTRIRYVIDPWSDSGNELKRDEVLARMTGVEVSGVDFDGAWMDTCNIGDFNVCDGYGRAAARAWKVQANGASVGIGVKYTDTDFRDGQDYKMDFIQSEVNTALGKAPVLVANSLSWEDLGDTANNQMMAALLKSTTLKSTPIDGFCMEHTFDAASNGTTTFGNKLTAVRQGIDGDLAILPMIGDAGGFSVTDDEPDNSARQQLEPFAYAMYLLAIQPDQDSRKAMFGTYAFHSDADGTNRHFAVDPQYRWPIGKPLDTWTNPEDWSNVIGSGGYQTATGSNVYRREFENAYVYVCTNSTAVAVTLPQTLVDPVAGEYVSGSVTLQPMTGKIYLKQPAALPDAPWSQAEVGSPAALGYATGSGSVYTLVGAGSGTLGTGDGLHFMYQAASGDCTIIARVDSVSAANSASEAGVMIRETTDAGSIDSFVTISATTSPGILAKYRASTNGGTNGATVGSVTAPYWLKLQRIGNTFYRYRSTDGSSWTQIGSNVSITMNSSTLIGLVVASHTTDGSVSTATFSNVSVTP